MDTILTECVQPALEKRPKVLMRKERARSSLMCRGDPLMVSRDISEVAAGSRSVPTERGGT